MHASSSPAQRPASRPVPKFARNLSTPYGRNHPKGVSAIRYAVAVWLAILGSIFCALGYYWGALFFPAAVAIAALAYFMPRWNRALQAEGDS